MCPIQQHKAYNQVAPAYEIPATDAVTVDVKTSYERNEFFLGISISAYVLFLLLLLGLLDPWSFGLLSFWRRFGKGLVVGLAMRI